MPVQDGPEKRDAVLDLSTYLARSGDCLKDSFKQMVIRYALEIYEKGREAGLKEAKKR